jgi:uncharacterized membrane protein
MRTVLRKYSFFVYWVAFAVLTLHQAQYPGLMAHPERWVYPWRAVLVVWTILAILIGAFYLILRPMTFHRSWWRLVCALAFAAVLLGLGIASVVTDMPGYYYIPAQFSIVTMALMLLLAIVQISLYFLGKLRRA